MPMVGGLYKLVRNTGQVADMHATLVYRGEVIEIWEESGASHYKHVRSIDPNFNDDPGNIIGAYAIIRYKDGNWEMEWMSRRHIDRVRAVSKAKNGPWLKWYDEMAKKSADPPARQAAGKEPRNSPPANRPRKRR